MVDTDETIDVFISYSRDNLDFVEKLRASLAAKGKTVWLDQNKVPMEGILPGSNWWEEIKRGIELADNFLFVICPESVVSPYCNAEVAYAFQQKTRLLPVMYHGLSINENAEEIIDGEIDAISHEIELPPTISAPITSLKSLASQNWTAIGAINWVDFAEDMDFVSSLELLIRALELDVPWIRLRSQIHQAARAWTETGDDSYLWSEERLKTIREEVECHQQELTRVEHDFLRSEIERLEEKLEDPSLDHTTRSQIGERLYNIGDTRPGVGLRADDLPDIAWCEVPGGTIEQADERGLVIIHPFYIAKYPTTYVQFQAFLYDSDGYEQDRWWQGLEKIGLDQKGREVNYSTEPGNRRFEFDNHPRENVSWYEAVAFCRWLTAKLPLNAQPDPLPKPPHEQSGTLRWDIRLPTEHEWQQAATGGNATNKYPWGAHWDSSCANTENSGLRRTTAVGLYPHGTAPCGALDMAGNVWEWCLNTYYPLVDAIVDNNYSRGIRGGSWKFLQESAQTSYRTGFSPEVRSDDIGFRVVISWTL